MEPSRDELCAEPFIDMFSLKQDSSQEKENEGRRRVGSARFMGFERLLLRCGIVDGPSLFEHLALFSREQSQKVKLPITADTKFCH